MIVPLQDETKNNIKWEWALTRNQVICKKDAWSGQKLPM